MRTYAGHSSAAESNALYRRNLDGTWTHLGPNQGPLYDCELFALRFSRNNPNLILTGGMALLRSLREDAPFTWRTALGWVSWGITLALAIGAIVDVRRAAQGKMASPDSPVHGSERKIQKRHVER